MAARGIQPAPTRPSDMGAPAGSMRATAAACQVDLPHLPVVPERPPHEADVDVEEAEAEARQGTAGQSGSGADAAGDGPEAEEAAQGAAQGAAPEPDQAAEQLKCKQASEEAREKGNVCFRKHQWEQVGSGGRGCLCWAL